MKLLSIKGIFILALVLLLFTKNSHGQKDYRKGYIVNHKNDTIHGLINHIGQLAHAKKCNFKKTSASKPVIYTPKDINAYRFQNGKLYVAKKTTKEDQEEVKRFFEYMVDGLVDMYFYRDKDGEHYFVDKGDGKLIPLKNEDLKFTRNTQEYIKKSKEYIGTLSYVFSKSPSTVNKAQHARLAHKDLIKLAKKYHNEVCTSGEECIVFASKPPKLKLNFGITVGTTFNKLNPQKKFYENNYGDAPGLYLNYTSFKSSNFPTIGAFLKLDMPSLNKRFFVQYDLKMGKSTSDSYFYELNKTTDHEIVNDIQMTQTIINNSISGNYDVNMGGITATLIAGGFIDYYQNTSYQQHYESNKDGDNLELIDKESYPFNNTDMGYLAGIGVSGKIFQRRISLNMIYRNGLGSSKFLRTNYLSLNIGYQFGKIN